MPVDTEDPTKPENDDPIGDPDIGIQVEMRALKQKCIEMATAIDALETAAGVGISIGDIVLKGTVTVPTGYLLCNGDAVSRTTYADLFAVIGVSFGAGDTVNTFNIPDLRGKVPMGAGTGSGLTARVLGVGVGAETVTLDTTMIPAHTHSNFNDGAGQGGGGVANEAVRGTSISTVNVTGSTGGGLPHPNVQPSLPIAFMIKALA